MVQVTDVHAHGGCRLSFAEWAIRLSSFCEAATYRVNELIHPVSTHVRINKTLTRAILWYGSETLANGDSMTDPQEVYFFPLLDPLVEEWQYLHPRELEVCFIGTKLGLADLGLINEPSFASLQTLTDGEIFSLLRVNKSMRGMGGRDLRYVYFVAGVVLRVEEGKLIKPLPFVSERFVP